VPRNSAEASAIEADHGGGDDPMRGAILLLALTLEKQKLDWQHSRGARTASSFCLPVSFAM